MTTRHLSNTSSPPRHNINLVLIAIKSHSGLFDKKSAQESDEEFGEILASVFPVSMLSPSTIRKWSITYLVITAESDPDRKFSNWVSSLDDRQIELVGSFLKFDIPSTIVLRDAKSCKIAAYLIAPQDLEKAWARLKAIAFIQSKNRTRRFSLDDD